MTGELGEGSEGVRGGMAGRRFRVRPKPRRCAECDFVFLSGEAQVPTEFGPVHVWCVTDFDAWKPRGWRE